MQKIIMALAFVFVLSACEAMALSSQDYGKLFEIYISTSNQTLKAEIEKNILENCKETYMYYYCLATKNVNETVVAVAGTFVPIVIVELA